MSCPTDEVFAAWASEALPAPEVERLAGHAADCVACRGLAIAMLGLVARPAGAMLGAVGATIGRYRVVAAVGQGAMGIVLRGHDPVLERDVAIKMVNSMAATAEQRARMLHEAKMLALVDHPNVVRVHDAGLVDDEVFVAMEYVVGATLESWLAEAPRALADRLEVLTGVGAGTAAIHAAGIVHRDLKPDNILVRGGRGVIVDFGLARSIGAGGPTGSGIAGTPRFLAPEVRTGGPASALADQYAWWTVVESVLADAARPASRLAETIARGRADDPAQRFATMAEAVGALTAACTPARRRWWWIPASAAVALAAILIARATGDAPTGDVPRCARSAAQVHALWRDAREPIRRAFLATGVAYATTSFDRTARVYDAYVPTLAIRLETACRFAPAELATITVARRRCLADRVDQLAAQLARLTAATGPAVLQATEDAWSDVDPSCDDPRALLFGPFGARPITPALGRRLAEGRARLHAEDLERGLPIAQALVADARRAGDAPAELAALQLLGDLRARMDQSDAAIDAFQDALRLAEAQGNDLDAANVLAHLADQAVDKRDAATGHRMVALARAKLERMGGNPVLDAGLHRLVAYLFSIEYRCRDAEAEIRQALARFEQVYGPDHPRIGMTLSEVANLSCTVTPETVDAARRSLAILERAYGADHPNVGGARVNLAVALLGSGQLTEAHDTLVRADAIFVGAFGPDHPMRRAALLLLGDVEARRHHHGAAIDAYRRAGALIDASLGPSSADAGAVHTSIGDVLLDASRFAEALAEHRQALAIVERARGKDHHQLVGSLEGAARAQLGLARPAAAVAFAERALALRTRDGADSAPEELGATRWLLARALWDSGVDRARARALAEQARATVTGDQAPALARWLATHALDR